MRAIRTLSRFKRTCRKRERTTNRNPTRKKEALKAIIDDYNVQYGTNHSIGEFDLYYQDVQQRIKDQMYTNADYPRARTRSTLSLWWTCSLTGI